jgi:hypothetical protein
MTNEKAQKHLWIPLLMYQWRAFMQEQGLRYLVLSVTPKTRSLFSGDPKRAGLQRIGGNSWLTIFALESRAQPGD